MLDNSISMKSYWSEAYKPLKDRILQACNLDDYGIDLCFATGDQTSQVSAEFNSDHVRLQDLHELVRNRYALDVEIWGLPLAGKPDCCITQQKIAPDKPHRLDKTGHDHTRRYILVTDPHIPNMDRIYSKHNWMDKPLSQIMDQYLSGRQEKKKTVFVFTDGVWEASQGAAVEELIVQFWCSRCRRRNLHNLQIHFVQFGDDERGLARLKRLQEQYP